MQLMDLTAYRELWKTHAVVALLASAIVARMPVMATMVPLAFLAAEPATSAGLVSSRAYSVGPAVASVVADGGSAGARKVVIGTGMAWGASMAVVAVLPYSWYRVLPVAAAVAGIFVAPVGSACGPTGRGWCMARGCGRSTRSTRQRRSCSSSSVP